MYAPFSLLRLLFPAIILIAERKTPLPADLCSIVFEESDARLSLAPFSSAAACKNRIRLKKHFKNKAKNTEFFLRPDKTSVAARVSIVDGWIYKILWAQNKKHTSCPRARYSLCEKTFLKALTAKITAASSQHKH